MTSFISPLRIAQAVQPALHSNNNSDNNSDNKSNSNDKNNTVIPQAVRCVITGHSPDGKSRIGEDTRMARHGLACSLSPSPEVTAQFTDINWADCVPIPTQSMSAEPYVNTFVGHEDCLNPPPSGVMCRIVDMPPGQRAPLHRTLSLDHGVVLRGSVTLELEDGQQTVLHEGDVVLQRGTLHSWHNQSTSEWCRMFFVLVSSEKVKVGDHELDFTSGYPYV